MLKDLTHEISEYHYFSWKQYQCYWFQSALVRIIYLARYRISFVKAQSSKYTIASPTTCQSQLDVKIDKFVHRRTILSIGNIIFQVLACLMRRTTDSHVLKFSGSTQWY